MWLYPIKISQVARQVYFGKLQHCEVLQDWGKFDNGILINYRTKFVKMDLFFVLSYFVLFILPVLHATAKQTESCPFATRPKRKEMPWQQTGWNLLCRLIFFLDIERLVFKVTKHLSPFAFGKSKSKYRHHTILIFDIKRGRGRRRLKGWLEDES